MNIIISESHTLTGVGYLLFWTSFLGAGLATLWQALMFIKILVATQFSRQLPQFKPDAWWGALLSLGLQGGFILFVIKLLIY